VQVKREAVQALILAEEPVPEVILVHGEEQRVAVMLLFVTK
jgi:hypothetical protein